MVDHSTAFWLTVALVVLTICAGITTARVPSRLALRLHDFRYRDNNHPRGPAVDLTSPADSFLTI